MNIKEACKNGVVTFRVVDYLTDKFYQIEKISNGSYHVSWSNRKNDFNNSFVESTINELFNNKKWVRTNNRRFAGGK